MKLLIVQSLWNESITGSLLQSARESLKASGFEIEELQVPGALEIPLAIKWSWAKGQRTQKPVLAAVACGCIIRGDTYHFEMVANESSRALMDLSLDLRIPIGHAILACDTQEQAVARRNKGKEAAESVLEMLKLKSAKEF